MRTLSGRTGRAIVTGLFVIATCFVAGETARADAAALSDPNDTTSKLDVTSGNVSNTVSTVTYTITMDPFTATDVNEVIFEFDFNNNGVADHCLRVQQGDTQSGLEGVIYDSCNGSLGTGTADAVNIVGGNQLQVLLNIQELRNAGLGSGSSYRFRVLTIDTPSQNNLPPFVANDIAPESGFVLHKLGAVVCGAVITANVTLTQDLTGCRGDGLIIGKSGKKITKPNGKKKIKYVTINLAGFDIISAFNGSGFLAGSGIQAVGKKYVRVLGAAGSEISGFAVGVEFTDVTKSRLQNATMKTNATGVSVARGAGNLISGNTIQNSKDNGTTVAKEGIGLFVSGAGHSVATNTISGSATDGVVSPAPNTGNPSSGIVFTGNDSSTNGTQPPDPATLTGDGFDLDTQGAKLNGNIANNNDGDGFSAPSGTSGSGNTAAGNAGTNCAVPAAVGCS